MDTRNKILEVAYNLLSINGLNAFSYKDISNIIGIKTSSIHYHFPTKADLILAVITDSAKKQEEMMSGWKKEYPIKRLENFMDFYVDLAKMEKMCIIVAIASDIQGLDGQIKTELRKFYDHLTEWLTAVLDEGLQIGQFEHHIQPNRKANEILNSVAMIPILSRIGKDFSQVLEVKNTIIKSLALVN